MNTEREDAVVKHSSHKKCERALRDSLHNALETGPLKSEAQGLDLSVDIAGDASCDTHVADSRLLLDQRTALLCDVFLPKEWEPT